jgi:predicted nucleic acid-binding protein
VEDSSGFAYIDTSAFLKLLGAERESAMMTEVIDASWPHLIASEILAIEALRAASRIGGAAPGEVARLLHRIVLQPFSAAIRDGACLIPPPRLRTLDAIHLATAVALGEKVEAIFTYDKRLAEASADAGLRVLAPG